MQIQVAVAKVSKYASSESGDTLEMIERPHGGLSLVLVDGQRSGRSAKAISTLVAHKAISLLAEGIRDGAVARAAHDYLYTQRKGKVSATLNIVSVDMETKTLVISRNSHCPVIVQTGPEEQVLLDTPTEPVGVYRYTKPEIHELPLQVGMVIVVYTDGILSAGERTGKTLNAPALISDLYGQYADCEDIARPIADGLLNEALRLDEGRPADDISVLVVAVAGAEIKGEVRYLQVYLPIPPLWRP
ncbi:MAG TPA: serine/threonine-protein phosphatase [Chloroflexi bacterium]|nr:serine/threonine-protein phosphatase [Chloroflexota bacterium]